MMSTCSIKNFENHRCSQCVNARENFPMSQYLHVACCKKSKVGIVYNAGNKIFKFYDLNVHQKIIFIKIDNFTMIFVIVFCSLVTARILQIVLNKLAPIT